MPVIRSVFFDLYGTLFTYGNMGHAFQAWHQTLANALLSFGKKISIHEIKEHCKKFFTLPIAPNEEFTAYEIRLRKFFSDYQLEVSSTWLHSFANSSMDSWQAEITLHSEAIPLLSALQKRNIHTGIISNFEHAPHVRNLLKSSGLEPYLQTIILSAEVQLKNLIPEFSFWLVLYLAFPRKKRFLWATIQKKILKVLKMQACRLIFTKTLPL